MTVLVSLLESAVLFLCFMGIALGGIVWGKKYRDSKDTKESR